MDVFRRGWCWKWPGKTKDTAMRHREDQQEAKTCVESTSQFVRNAYEAKRKKRVRQREGKVRLPGILNDTTIIARSLLQNL